MRCYQSLFLLSAILCLLLSCNRSTSEQEPIKIGLITPITGGVEAVGPASINGAEMALEEINQKGGLKIGNKYYPVRLLIRDDKDISEEGVKEARKLVNFDGVVAIVGPMASRIAIPVASYMENRQVPMIAPWSTNPETTEGKEYVFRMAYLDTFQGQVMAKFALNQLGIHKAAVLFDEASAYNKGIAEIFKSSFEKLGGKVVAYETYITGEKDFTHQLESIKKSGAELIFLPNYYNEVPYQVAQAKAMKINALFLGSDTWGNIKSKDLPLLEGSFYSTHYSPESKEERTKVFVERYQAQYGQLPDDIAALTYDAFKLLFEAIQQGTTAPPTSESIKEQLQSIGDFKGVTGDMRYEQSGDPIKNAVIMQIQGGAPHFYKSESVAK